MPIALDTSVAVPLLVQTHQAHNIVVRWWNNQEIALSGHALAETYSVLTRLPGDLRLAPEDAARLLKERFAADQHGCTLATRDSRAKTTYDVIGVPVAVVA